MRKRIFFFYAKKRIKKHSVKKRIIKYIELLEHVRSMKGRKRKGYLKPRRQLLNKSKRLRKFTVRRRHLRIQSRARVQRILRLYKRKLLRSRRDSNPLRKYSS